MILPDDDYLLLSLVNTKLRDEYPTLSKLCEEEEWDMEKIVSRLSAIGYFYDSDKNAFR